MSPFVIFALPRSRTYWLAHFLTYGAWFCGHEQLLHCSSLKDAQAWLAQPRVGTAETAAAPFWRLLRPGTRVVTVRRPVAEVMGSLRRAGIGCDAATAQVLRAHDRKLDQIERRIPGVLSVRFHDLADEEVCAEMFEHCLPYEHDPEWWRWLDQQNIQIDMLRFARSAYAHAAALNALATEARAASRHAMMET